MRIDGTVGAMDVAINTPPSQVRELLGLTDEEQRRLVHPGQYRGALLAINDVLSRGLKLEKPSTPPYTVVETVSIAEHNRRMNAERARLTELALEAKSRYSWCSTADGVIERAGLYQRDPEGEGLQAELVIRLPIHFIPDSPDMRQALADGNPEVVIEALNTNPDRVYSASIQIEHNDQEGVDAELRVHGDVTLRAGFGNNLTNGDHHMRVSGGIATIEDIQVLR